MEQLERDEFLIEYAMELILIFDHRGRIIYANRWAEKKLGFEDGLCSHTIGEVFRGVFEETEYGFETEFSFGSEVQNGMAYRGNQTCFRVETRIMPYGEAKEQQYLCMMNDVSNVYALERKIQQVQQEAEDAAKVKSEFVANVTHELRTPVNGILGNVRQLIAGETDNKKLSTMHIVERGCNDMHSIINNILDFSKLEAGKFTLENRVFDFRGMVDYVKANHYNKITEKGLDFFVTISPEIPAKIIGDELRIVQILNNLLSNATKFTSVGKITLEILKTNQKDSRIELFFMVIDTGIGIDKEDEDKLFKSFSQVDASITRKFGGTGLGLNICKQLAELMGGGITVQSEKGRGSMFSFSIWADVPDGIVSSERLDSKEEALYEAQSSKGEEKKEFGTSGNIDELNKLLPKLVLSVEMENWEKAEMFMEMVRELTEGAPRESKSAVLRLKMAVQKSDYDKTIAAYNKLIELLGIHPVAIG